MVAVYGGPGVSWPEHMTIRCLASVAAATIIAGCGIGGRPATPQALQKARYCQKYLERCGDP